MTVHDQIKRLERIAFLNEDEFKYKIEIFVKTTKLVFYFECAEQADGHIFVNGNGNSVESAIEDAAKSIEVAKASWGYHE